MIFLGKTTAYWIEKYGGYLIGLFVFIIFMLWIKPEYYSYKELIQEIPSIGMCAFGFMLTFLGIILQGNSQTIEYMKSRKTLYAQFIYYNKIVVILSLVISLYSYIIGYVEIHVNIINFILYYIHLKEIFIALFWGTLAKFVFDLCVFVKIFYLLLK